MMTELFCMLACTKVPYMPCADTVTSQSCYSDIILTPLWAVLHHSQVFPASVGGNDEDFAKYCQQWRRVEGVKLTTINNDSLQVHNEPSW